MSGKPIVKPGKIVPPGQNELQPKYKINESEHHCPRGHPASNWKECVEDGHLVLCTRHKKTHYTNEECPSCRKTREENQRRLDKLAAKNAAAAAKQAAKVSMKK